MARSETIENLTRNLIRLITGFKENEENFFLSFDFVTSNFKYHKFLDTDSKRVKRIVEGLEEKFLIHCQDEKAKAFNHLCQCFLEKPAFEGIDRGQTDTHFAVLHLLLLLADSPTNSIYEVSASKPVAVLSEKFDWAAYLLEGEEIYIPYIDDESTDEDEDSVGEATVVPSFSDVPLSVVSDGPAKVERTLMSQRFYDQWGFPEGSESQPHGNKQWLHENLMTCYWMGETTKVDSLCSRSPNLSHDWESYLAQTNELYTPSKKIMLTEYQIIREILWMLNGVKELFLFKWNGEGFEPNDSIQVEHLTQNALSAFLGNFSRYGNIIHKSSQFVDLVRRGSYKSSEDTGVSRTYEAFAFAVFEFLQELRFALVEIEKNVCKQEETITMTSVKEDLFPVLKDLEVLDLVFTNGIELCDEALSSSQKALTLLGVLYQMLIDSDRLNRENRRQMSLLLCFWIKTCRPYVEIIDHWIFKGLLLDPLNEFIIQRKKDVKPSDEKFWEEAFSFTCELTSVVGGSQKNTKDGGEEEAASCGHVLTSVDMAVGFLLPVLREILLTGKSMELLKTLGRIKDIVQVKDCTDCLYTRYMESIRNQLLSNHDQTASSKKLESLLESRGSSASFADGEKPSVMLDIHVEKQLNEISSKDPFLLLNFEQLFHKETTLESTKNKEEDSWFPAAGVPVLVPLQWTLQNCLYSHLLTQYRLVSSTLLRILKQEYKLLDYFAAIRRFFLMEAGGAMYEFYTAIFDKIHLREPWQSVSFVNTILQEALQLHHHGDRERLSLSFCSGDEENQPSAQVTGSLDSIVLNYKISWPVNIVITARHMKIYNTVFLFLLQIKHAKYVLDRLRFSDFEEVKHTVSDFESESRLKSNQIHRLHIFRMRLLHFVNSLHDYMMTRIVHSVGIEFQTEMEAAVDLDEVITTHNAYVQLLHERCLLHQKISVIRDFITELLSFAKTVEGLWNNDGGLTRWQTLSDVETKFMRCINFLSSMIQKVTTRGTFPHLESLAFALVTCNEAVKQTR